MKTQSAAKAVSWIVIITFISQLLGFIREMVLAATFGTGVAMDAYNMALSLIGILPVLLTSYIASTYIPEYTYARNESETEATSFHAHVLTITLVFAATIAIVGFIFAPTIVRIFALGFTGYKQRLTIQMLRLLVWMIPVQIAMLVQRSTLNARKSHILPTLTATSANFFIIPAVLFWAQVWDIWTLVGAYVFSLVFQCVILFFADIRHTQPFRPIFNLNAPRIQKTIRLAIPTIALSAIWQINTVVDRNIASGLATGTVSAYGFGLRLTSYIPGLVFAPFTTVFFSRISEHAAKKDMPGSLDLMWRTVEILLAVALPVCAITMFMRTEIVRIVFERGAFGAESTNLVGLVLMFYIWTLVTNAVTSPLSSTILAWQDLRGMIPRGIITIAVNIALSLWLSRYYGVIGVVVGTVVSGGVNALLLVATLRRRWGPLGLSRTIIEGIKMTACAAVCGLLARVLRGFLPPSNGTVIMDIFRFGTVTVICGTVFYTLAIGLRVRSVKAVFTIVLGMVKRIIRLVLRRRP